MIFPAFNLILPYMVTQVKPSVKRARDLYEAALDHFGTSHPGECVFVFAGEECVEYILRELRNERKLANIQSSAGLSRNLEKITRHLPVFFVMFLLKL